MGKLPASNRVYENGKHRAVLTIGREGGATMAIFERFRAAAAAAADPAQVPSTARVSAPAG